MKYLIGFVVATAIMYNYKENRRIKKALLQTIDSTELLANAIMVDDEIIKAILEHTDNDELLEEVGKILEKFKFDSIVEEWFKPSDEL